MKKLLKSFKGKIFDEVGKRFHEIKSDYICTKFLT